MITRRKCLSEDISSVGLRGHVRKSQLTTLLQLTSKKVAESNVLRSVLQALLPSQGQHGLVVYVQHWRRTRRLSKVSQKVGAT
ncbi:unnamed protein product [Closterium sp. NIES-65]|nr:unnamed protein product [Closterium sp. NIES-65]